MVGSKIAEHLLPRGDLQIEPVARLLNGRLRIDDLRSALSLLLMPPNSGKGRSCVGNCVSGRGRRAQIDDPGSGTSVRNLDMTSDNSCGFACCNVSSWVGKHFRPNEPFGDVRLLSSERQSCCWADADFAAK